MTDYLTIAESLRQNAQRHRDRALAHEIAGRPDWAVGSMRKAEKNDLRARLLEPEIPSYIKHRITALADAVAASIMRTG